ncbi:hypothetical protein [Haloarcula regularis]|nr:hypothetical protein [Halomicroarcula sp. SYNS111]
MGDWGWHKMSETGNETISPHRNVSNPKEWYMDTHGRNLNQFLTDKVATDLSEEYVTDERQKEALQILKSRLEHIREDLDDELVRDRVEFLMVEVQNQINNLED